MKKTLSLLLAVLLLLCVLPLYAAADEVILTGSYLEANDYVLSPTAAEETTTFILPEGPLFVIPAGKTLYLEKGVELLIKGTLSIYADGGEAPASHGSVTSRGGNLTVCCWEEDGVCKTGKIDNPQYVYGNETEEIHHYFAEILVDGFPDMQAFYDSLVLKGEPAFNPDNQYLWVDYFYSNNWDENESQQYLKLERQGLNTNHYFKPLYEAADADTPADLAQTTGTAKTIITVPLNQYLSVRIAYVDRAKRSAWLNAVTPEEKEEFVIANGILSGAYDAGGFGMKFNEKYLSQTQSFFTTKINKAGRLSFILPEKSIRKQYSIYIPNEGGYKTFEQGTGIMSDSDNTVKLRYGDTFMFRVTVNEDYSDSQSEMRVYMIDSYIYNQEYVESMDITEYKGTKEFLPESDPAHDPTCYIDENGIYHITNVTGDFTVVVKGLVANKTLSLVGNILEIFKSLLKAFNQVINYIREIFHIA